MIDTNPDMYGVRRSSRSRKEPERYNVNEELSDSDSTKKTPSKKIARRKE